MRFDKLSSISFSIRMLYIQSSIIEQRKQSELSQINNVLFIH